MRYLFASNLSKLFALILTMQAACSLACAQDVSGQWNMVANTNYNFILDLQQSGDQITGTMTCTNIASEPVDTISGTISPDGTVQFTRKRAGQWTQVYFGSLSDSSGFMTITGSFDHNSQGQYPWSASKTSNPEQLISGIKAETRQAYNPPDLSDYAALGDLSGLNRQAIDKKYDASLVIHDQMMARPLDPGDIVLNPPSSLDYSQYVTMTGNQDGWGGCGGRSIIHIMNIIKEMEHPYTPDLSFWYLHARQDELIKNGVQELTKTLVENYGICTEASFPSDYDTAKLIDNLGNRDYSHMPQITDAINHEAGLYKLKTYGKSTEPTVENITSMLIKYGPLLAGGSIPLVTGNYVDHISGTVSGGLVEFTRERPGEWTQVYSGSISNNIDNLYMEGTYTHSGSADTFPWNATLWKSTQSNPAQGSIPSDISGNWAMKANNAYDFSLDLVQQGSQLSGTMSCSNCEGHCVTIVGYDDGIQAFKCLNSYGDTWNGNGYFLLPYEKVAENLGYVISFENLFSDRSSTQHAFSARINVTAQKRNQLIIKVGAEGHEAKTVWDTPCQVECIDNSKTICIDVPLPSYASSVWPPAPNQWYVEITNTGPGTAKVNEVTLARLINETSCLSVGKFRTETYAAQSLPTVTQGDTAKVYVTGEGMVAMPVLMEWFSLKFYPDQFNKFRGSLDVSYPLGGSAAVADREVKIYRKSQPSCLNMPPKWTTVGSVVTGSDGSFTFEPQEAGVYAAAILDSIGNVEASSSEASSSEASLKASSIPPELTYVPKEISKVVVNPVDEMRRPTVSPEVIM